MPARPPLFSGGFAPSPSGAWAGFSDRLQPVETPRLPTRSCAAGYLTQIRVEVLLGVVAADVDDLVLLGVANDVLGVEALLHVRDALEDGQARRRQGVIVRAQVLQAAIHHGHALRLVRH